MFFTFGAVAQITPTEPIGNIPNPNDPEPPLDCRHDAEESWKIHPEDNKSWHICDNAAAIGYRAVVPAGVKLYTLGGDFLQNSNISDYFNRVGRSNEHFTRIGGLESITNFNFNPYGSMGGFQGILHQNLSGISTFQGVWDYEDGQVSNPVLGWRADNNQDNDNTRLQIGFIDAADVFNEHFSVLQDGRVGIGTTEPAQNSRLYVRGNLFVSSGGISLDGGNTTITSFSTDGTLGSNSNEILPTEQAVKTYVDTRITASDDWTLSGNDLYNNNNGNVGIGTQNPTAKLHVEGVTRTSFLSVMHDGGNGQNDAMMDLGREDNYWHFVKRSGDVQNGTAANSLVISHYDGNSWAGGLTIHRNKEISFPSLDGNSWTHFNYEETDNQNNIKKRNYIRNQTIIGQKAYSRTNPPAGQNFNDYALGVDGLIVAKQIAVEKPEYWADFVFDEGYELPTLESVQQHIKTKKHLPGIPTAAEVAENGVDLVDMQVKLLQKIEEMTLYMIELKEENKRLNERITTLEK